MPDEWVFVGLGCNLGTCAQTLAAATQALQDPGALSIQLRSPLYRTSAFEVAQPQPPYLNQVIGGHTSLTPIALLECLLAVERHFGRERPSFRAPRTLDLDLLAFGYRQLTAQQLTLPHPEAHRRTFVLLPWADISPDFYLQHHTIRDWLATLPADLRDEPVRLDETHLPQA